MKLINIPAVASILVMSSSSAMGHDTTHIHPMITDRTADLIAASDASNKKYEEIYKEVDLVRIYWGKDYDEDIAPFDINELKDVPLDKYTDYTNVTDGVVQEDAPAGKVSNHFYQATSGRGMTLTGLSPNTPSANQAMEYFKNAIDFYGGYTEQAKQRAYFTFGQALHHVQDMSSPAHIHNDIHLVTSDTEKDDYEGWYLVFQKLNDSDLSGFFNRVDEISRVENPWVNIWGKSGSSNSMVDFVYDRTTYQGDLSFPRTNAVALNSEVSDETVASFLIRDPAAKPAASGELKNMFPCEVSPGVIDETVPNCLLWEEDSIYQLAHWTINAVGDFQHQYSTGSRNAWWPVEYENNPIGVHRDLVTFSGQFYLENLSEGNTYDNDNVFGDSIVIPAAFSNSILEEQAESLLPPAVEFGAGFTEYWFDVANTPPYLTSVKVNQAPKDSATVVSVYEARWEVADDEFEDVNDSHTNLNLCNPGFGPVPEALYCLPFGDSVTFKKEDRRSFISRPETLNYIHADKPVTFVLEFNEPIASIEFIGLGSFNDTGQCISSNGCLEFTPDPTEWTIDEEMVFTYELAGSQLQGLDGKYSLTVKAIDKNNHRDGMGGTDGAHLDATPASPARRNLFKVAADPTSNEYPWHQRGLTTEDGDEEDANEKYSYDFEGGDVNHSLLIDTSPPTAAIDIIDTLTQ